MGKVVFVAAVVGLLLCIYCVNGVDLSDNLHYFETLKTLDVSRRVRRSVDPHPTAHVHEILFHSLGREFHLYVKQTPVVSKSFNANIVNNGVVEPLDVDTGNFYTGTVKDELNSEVQLHWEGSDLHASITSQDDIIYVEPSWRHLERSDNHSMIVYRHSDLKWRPEDFTAAKSESFCEMKDLRKNQDEKLEDDIKLFHRDNKYHKRKKRQIVMPHVGTHTMCGLFAVADHYFFKAIGGSDKRITGEYLIGMMGRVNNIYQKTVWGEGVTNLGFEIQEMLIHSTPEDKIGDHYNMPNRPNDMDAVLDWFGADIKKMTSFCLAHLFTYQQFPGKLGLAWVGSWRYTDPGGICSSAAYVSTGLKIAVNTGVSTFQNPGGSRALAAQALITVSHELGHNWGSEHDPDTTECAPDVSNNGKFIMYYRATTGYDTNNQVFSPCSKRFIFKVVMKKGYNCFKEKSSGGKGLCGNGRLDSGEECDGGYDGDYCCDAECKLRAGAKCSDMNYACCQNCNIAPAGTKCFESSMDDFDCLGAANCTGNSLNCPEPPKLTGPPCHDGGKCLNGVCQDICEADRKFGCICLGANACKQCCIDQFGICSPVSGGLLHQNGRPCEGGFCENGVCKKSDPPVIKRLFLILENFSVDKIALFMKNNLVWTILLFSSIVWIIAIIIIERHDRKEFAKDEKVLAMMDPKQDGRRVDINLHEDDQLEFLGSRTLKPRIRRERGRDEIKREEEIARREEFDREARDAGF